MNAFITPLLSIPITVIAVVAIVVGITMGALWALTEVIYEEWGFNPF